MVSGAVSVSVSVASVSESVFVIPSVSARNGSGNSVHFAA